MSGFLQRRQNSASSVFCPHHPDARLFGDRETGDMVCTQCGLVIGDRLVDAGAEWHNFDGEDNSRVGQAQDPLMDVTDLGTIIGPTPTNGKELSKYAKYSGLSSKERTLKAAHRELKDSAGRLHLSDAVVDTAFGIYKDVTGREVFKGSRKDALITACIYIACNQEQVPRALGEICKSSTCTKSQVARCYKDVFKLLKITNSTDGHEKEFVERFCSELHLAQDVTKLAATIAHRATGQDLFPDRGPDVVCAAAILLACAATGQATRLADVCEVSGATRTGLSLAYRVLIAHTTVVYPVGFVAKVPVENLPKVDAL